MFSVDQLRSSLTHQVTDKPRRGHAAVAMMLRGQGSTMQLCFIVRAQRDSDRWSGQVAFPGGRPDPVDDRLQATAERETREEVGVTLTAADRIGALPPVPLQPPGSGGILAPFVYHLGDRQPTLEIEPSEVASAFWSDVGELFDPARRTTLDWSGMTFPGIELGDHVLWGLTLRICDLWVTSLGETLELSWPPMPGH